MEIIRKRYVFTGWVQGVGFRYRARNAAAAVGVTGFVRNEPDGSVTMELQGTPAQHDRVIQALHSGRFLHIERIEVKTIPLAEGERDFETDYRQEALL